MSSPLDGEVEVTLLETSSAACAFLCRPYFFLFWEAIEEKRRDEDIGVQDRANHERLRARAQRMASSMSLEVSPRSRIFRRMVASLLPGFVIVTGRKTMAP